ncbi:hypothetical protein [Nonomuraea sp. SBT364]|nr:hypothetical protein [Nonomuraea sp. SBT364]
MRHEDSEADLVAAKVDRHPTGPTEPDEEAVLRRLYGDPDADGVYRGRPS